MSNVSSIMKAIFCILIGIWISMGRLASQVEVVYFLSPTCPICRFYTLEMKAISADYADAAVEFRAYAVGPLLTDSTVTAFEQEYRLPFEVLLDDTMHRRLNATITPEVFVLQDGQVVYHGRIDDSYVRVGRRRAHVKNRELRDVLESVMRTGQPILNVHVPAIGCIIEK